MVHQLGPLGEDSAGANGVMANVAVAHIVIGRQPDRQPVCCEFACQRRCSQRVEGGCLSLGDGVAGTLRRNANPITHNDEHRTGAAGEGRVGVKGKRHGLIVESRAAAVAA